VTSGCGLDCDGFGAFFAASDADATAALVRV